ncbi:RHS repeat-associated core domain-containing protein [Candidatus Poribacteria bacterium]|nr:RHS repeat-associated core domain-containing protein [Candidatus Poribacteria bacterium]
MSALLSGVRLFRWFDSATLDKTVLNSSGGIVKTYRYDAYGKILQETGPAIPGGFTYTGREFHSRSGLYYYRARFYDPSIGRFISQDPAGVAAGPNQYAYVSNTPVMAIDPLGLIELILVGGTLDEKESIAYRTNVAFAWADGKYPEEVKIIQARDWQDFQDALTNNENITKFTYDGHAWLGMLYPSIGGQFDVHSVKKLNTSNLSPDAQIFLNGCNTAGKQPNGGPSMAEVFSAWFQRDVMGWEGEMTNTPSGPQAYSPGAHAVWFRQP